MDAPNRFQFIAGFDPADMRAEALVYTVYRAGPTIVCESEDVKQSFIVAVHDRIDDARRNKEHVDLHAEKQRIIDYYNHKNKTNGKTR